MIRIVLVICVFVVFGRSVGSSAETEREHVDFFEREVRPLLASTCGECHGEKKQESGLRLDQRQAILAGGERGAAVQPGDPEGSLLIQAIRHSGELQMPPDGQLTAPQIETLTRWVALGAPWPDDGKLPVPARRGEITDADRQFWSYQPFTVPVVPSCAAEHEPVDSPVDRFILSRLDAVGIRPAPRADRKTLIRRATFDLIGLPPTPAEVTAFVRDPRPDAFVHLIDRLMAAPAYGERWGRHWLDVVRYADTAGETADYPVREAYRYRDYVIRAFNSDKPYATFIREQIAGDILAHAGPANHYAERVTATGYLAISRRFGFDSENYQHLTIQDTIDNLGQVFLGLTLGCARCHEHKFDPVSMRDYYALYGIFESTRYAFPGSEQKQRLRAMVPLLPPHESHARWRAYDRHLAMLCGELDKNKQARPSNKVRSLDELDGDFEIQAVAAGGSLGVLVPPWSYEGAPSISNGAQSPYTNVYVWGGVGVVFPNDDRTHGIRQAIPAHHRAATSGKIHFNVDFRTTAREAGGSGSYRIALGDHDTGASAVEWFISADGLFVRNGDHIESIRSLDKDVWYNLRATIDSTERTYSGAIQDPSGHVEFSRRQFAATWSGKLDSVSIDTRGHVAGVRPGLEIDQVALSDSPVAELKPASSETITNTTNSAESSPISAEQLARQVTAAIQMGPCPLAYGVAEGTPHHARIHKRGEPTKLGDEVPRRFLEILGGDPLAGEGSGRLELAEWIARDANPLTSRVLVNRLWQYHFGRGLVATPNDFGTRGQRPTHPELLDYLAAEFRLSGGSIKHMHRVIMLSAAYQRASEFHSEAGAIDPENTLCWRFSRRRLDAESLRDALLAISESLDDRLGGEHPFPPMQNWTFTQHAPFNGLYETRRRSVYLMTQRIQRHPLLALFDGPDTNTSTPERGESTVPTQALFAMNDPFVHELSHAFARRILAAEVDDVRRIVWAHMQVLSRRPDDDEIAAGLKFQGTYRDRLASLAMPSGEQELACWSAYARTLFSGNEFVFVD